MGNDLWSSLKTTTQRKEYLQQLLRNNEKALLRALLLINGLQTNDEKESRMSLENNNVGFTKWDAQILSELAEKTNAHIELSSKEMVLLKYKMPKYWKQLAIIAEAKQKAKTERDEMFRIQVQQEKDIRNVERERQVQLCIEQNIPCSYGICEECMMQY